jgi:hypothetical protein
MANDRASDGNKEEWLVVRMREILIGNGALREMIHSSLFARLFF